MTRDEFEEFCQYHAVAYTRLLDHFEDNPGIEERWFKALAPVSLEAAKAASDAAFAGEAEFKPTYQDMPKQLRAISQKYEPHALQHVPRKPKFIDGKPVFDCHDCCDEGLRSIIAPRSMKALLNAVRNSEAVQAPLHSCVVSCTCDRGVAKGRHHRIPNYDPARMVLWSGSRRSNQRAVQAWLEEKASGDLF